MSKHFDGELNTEGRAGQGVVETGEVIVHQLGNLRALRPDVAYQVYPTTRHGSSEKIRRRIAPPHSTPVMVPAREKTQ